VGTKKSDEFHNTGIRISGVASMKFEDPGYPYRSFQLEDLINQVSEPKNGDEEKY
jgi:hypothetical protein